MFNMGMMEILLIGAIALVVIGPKNLPKFARAVGRGLKEFKKATNELSATIKDELDDTKHPELKDLSEMANDIKSQTVTGNKNITDYLETAANVMESAEKK